MKKTEWNEALNNIEDDLVKEYIQTKEKLAKKKKIKASLLRYGALAACVALLISTVALAPMLKRSAGISNSDSGSKAETEAVIPPGNAVIDNANKITRPLYPSDAEIVTLSADKLSNVFEQIKALDGTNQYTKVYTLDEKHLNVSPIPDSEYLPIYYSIDNMPTKELLQDFIDRNLESAAKYFNVRTSSCSIEAFDSLYLKGYEAEVSCQSLTSDQLFSKPYLDGKMRFTAIDNRLRLSYSNGYSNRLSLENSILKNDTDEEIKIKLKNEIEAVCSAFSKNYTEIMISRYYSDEQLKSISVYLYSPDDSVMLDGITSGPATEFIHFTYYTDWGYGTSHNWGGSKDEAYLCEVELCEYTDNYAEFYDTKISKMLSLEEAEVLLQKGFVFGGHSCPICMANQPLVDFTDYDLVGLTYVSENGLLFVNKYPFYAFYKYIGDNEYGLKTYAKTYVCAVEVEGLEEYYKNQEKNHNSLIDIIDEIQ